MLPFLCVVYGAGKDVGQFRTGDDRADGAGAGGCSAEKICSSVRNTLTHRGWNMNM